VAALPFASAVCGMPMVTNFLMPSHFKMVQATSRALHATPLRTCWRLSDAAFRGYLLHVVDVVRAFEAVGVVPHARALLRHAHVKAVQNRLGRARRTEPRTHTRVHTAV
jgi:hypothetical protein